MYYHYHQIPLINFFVWQQSTSTLSFHQGLQQPCQCDLALQTCPHWHNGQNNNKKLCLTSSFVYLKILCSLFTL